MMILLPFNYIFLEKDPVIVLRDFEHPWIGGSTPQTFNKILAAVGSGDPTAHLIFTAGARFIVPSLIQIRTLVLSMEIASSSRHKMSGFLAMTVSLGVCVRMSLRFHPDAYSTIVLSLEIASFISFARDD
jgi:hypothetical protein